MLKSDETVLIGLSGGAYSKMKIELLEDIKTYTLIIAIFDLLLTIFSGFYAYEDYIKGEARNYIFYTFIVLLIVFLILLLVYFSLRFYLKKKEGENFVGFLDVAKTLLTFMFPILDKEHKNMSISDFGKAAESSSLWRTLGTGINKKKLFQFLFLFLIGIYLGYNGIIIWVTKDSYFAKALLGRRVRLDPDYYLASGFAILLMAIIVLINASVVFFGIKKKGSALLEYTQKRKIDFMTLNKDFTESIKCGNGIWVGKQNLFVQTKGCGKVIPLNEILCCQLHRMGGTHPAQFFIPYYFIEIQGKEETIFKYCILTSSFKKMQTAIQMRENA